MPTEHETIQFIRTVLQDHTDYWEHQSAELHKYRSAYNNRFWRDQDAHDSMIRVETSDAFSYIEGFIASLFSRAPAVEVGSDAASKGDAELTQAVANRFLYNQRRHLEDGSRLALIYPSAFFKLAPRDSDNILDSVSVKAVAAWEIIVDRDATCWESQRYVGHTYYIPLAEAKERFGARKYQAVCKVDYLGSSEKVVTNRGEKNINLPDAYLYIQVVELYDMLDDKLYFWSPNYSNGEKLLDKDTIPIRTYDDRPLPPIAPLYYSRIPDSPLEGLSAMSRVYDQIYEKNILRTYWANSVRRDSRQYLYKEGKLDEEQLAKITAGIDGAMIGVDEESLDGLIKAIPVESNTSNFDRYLAYIEQDINRGSILAPFTRGEATNATATEITALAQYSASEIGKMARDRDEAIEMVANIYVRILSFITEESSRAVITVEGKARTVQAKDLDAKFRISALDQGSQPLSDAIKKQNLIQLLPILQQLGVSNDKIKEEIVRAWDLPEHWAEPVEAAEPGKIGPRSIPDDLEGGPAGESQEGPQALANALIGRAQTQGLE